MGRPHDKELIAAAGKGHNPRVERMLREGANVNAEREYGYTALLEACSRGHLEVVRTLLNAGADPNVFREGRSPLVWAAGRGDEQIVRLLLRRGAEVTGTQGIEALSFAIAKGHDSVAVVLVAAGAPTECGGDHVYRVYRHAVRYRRERVAHYLRSKGLHR